MRILIVGASEQQRRPIEGLLRARGHEVVAGEGEAAALEALVAQDPDSSHPSLLAVLLMSFVLLASGLAAAILVVAPALK